MSFDLRHGQQRFTGALLLALSLMPATTLAGEVSVTGEGKVEYTPDSVRLQFTAREQDKTPQVATEAVKGKMAQWEEAVSAYRNQLEDYDSATLNLYTQQLPPAKEGEQPRSRAVASQSVSFTLPALDSLNPVLQAAQSSGLEYHISEGNFFHANEEALEREALGKAIDDAREQCEFIAKRLNQACGEVKMLSTSFGGHPAPMMMAEARGKSGPVTAIGDREVTVTVSATFEIE
ncbi:SIMPL domain-containing protein [Marinobacter fonticola]|uniref:SIMPL domain-containing protein n=1 Tax=Marinobacter fonticola TaxID=2603215 RepID=UPI00143DAA04|nr:SIMPL domain-containing protein [Marinobacter fonticola]